MTSAGERLIVVDVAPPGVRGVCMCVYTDVMFNQQLLECGISRGKKILASILAGNEVYNISERFRQPGVL